MSAKHKPIWSKWIILDENVKVRHTNHLDEDDVEFAWTFDDAYYEPSKVMQEIYFEKLEKIWAQERANDFNREN